MNNKRTLGLTVFYLIVLFTIINLSLMIVDVKNRRSYRNTKNIDSSFISYFQKENTRIGWVNIDEPDYDFTHDVSFYWFRFLLMPTQLDNKKAQDKIIVKYKNFSDVILFSNYYKYKILGVIKYESVAFLEKIK